MLLSGKSGLYFAFALVHDSRGIEIVNFTMAAALSAGTLYHLVPAHFYPWCYSEKLKSLRICTTVFFASTVHRIMDWYYVSIHLCVHSCMPSGIILQLACHQLVVCIYALLICFCPCFPVCLLLYATHYIVIIDRFWANYVIRCFVTPFHLLFDKNVHSGFACCYLFAIVLVRWP